MVRIILQAPGLDKPIALPFIKKDDLTMDRFMTRVEHVLQSKKDVKLDSDYVDQLSAHGHGIEGGRNEKTHVSDVGREEERMVLYYNLLLISTMICVWPAPS